MKQFLARFSLAFALVVFMSAAVCAQDMTNLKITQCGIRSEILMSISGDYGEKLVVKRLTNEGFVIEEYENPTTGTWTFLQRKQGEFIVCVVAFGRGFVVYNLPGLNI